MYVQNVEDRGDVLSETLNMNLSSKSKHWQYQTSIL